MVDFKIIDQTIYDKLVGKNVLLMMKENFDLTEVNIEEVTQHRIKVKIIGKHNAVTIGIRKLDVILFPMRAPRSRLKNIIKTITEINHSLEKYIEQFAYQVSK